MMNFKAYWIIAVAGFLLGALSAATVATMKYEKDLARVEAARANERAQSAQVSAALEKTYRERERQWAERKKGIEDEARKTKVLRDHAYRDLGVAYGRLRDALRDRFNHDTSIPRDAELVAAGGRDRAAFGVCADVFIGCADALRDVAGFADRTGDALRVCREQWTASGQK